MKKIMAAAAFAALALPATAGAHATVQPIAPQGPALTSARTSYLLRVPNERATVGTWKVVLLVPEAVQQGISFTKTPGWKMTLKTRDTGQKDEEGNAVTAVTKVTWTAKDRDAELDPHFLGEFGFRFQNPAQPTSLCFPVSQYYRKDSAHRAGGEVVRWWGNPTADTPASCVDVKSS
jgi:uncharacterized protein YcnI